MGGCLSQQQVDSEVATAHDLKANPVLEGSSASDFYPTNVDQLPAQGCSSENIALDMQKDEANRYDDELVMPVSNNQTEQPEPLISSNIHKDYQISDEATLLESNAKKAQNLIEPLHQKTLPEQLQHSVSSVIDQAALPPKLSTDETEIDVKVGSRDVKIQGTGPPYQGAVFNGKMYSKRVFDEVINDYVYVKDYLKPRGGVVM
jgi:hypothetical protein